MIIDMLSFPQKNPSESDLNSQDSLSVIKYISNFFILNKNNKINYKIYCIRNENILFDKKFIVFINKHKKKFGFIFMINPYKNNYNKVLKQIHLIGFKGIIFHSYIDHIRLDKNNNMINISKKAEKLKLTIGFSSAFGSKKIYDINPLKNSLEVIKSIKSNVILYHCGGLKINEVMLISEMWDNILLETSFSLSYWKNSSVESDLAFVIKKIGSHRIMFGSDSPFINEDQAIKDHYIFFKKYKFTKKDIDNILFKNANSLIHVK